MKRFLVVLPALAVLVMGAGCIKEDRSECPCRLFLDFTDVDTSSIASADILMTSEEGFEFVDVVESGYFADYMIKVPSHQISLQVLAGAGHCLSSDMSVVIPYGEECPKLFRHESVINADSEVVKERIRLRKNHCVLTILAEGDGQEFTGLVLKGNVAGYDMTGKPLRGDFEFALEEDTAVLPRQVDDSLMLELQDSKGNRISFSLGRYIEASGYDWSAPELDDVTVTLDYALTEVRLNVDGWESVYRYDMEI